jgi:hypothetical protein
MVKALFQSEAESDVFSALYKHSPIEKKFFDLKISKENSFFLKSKTLID